MMGIHIKPKLYGLTILELVEKQTGKISFWGIIQSKMSTVILIWLIIIEGYYLSVTFQFLMEKIRAHFSLITF